MLGSQLLVRGYAFLFYFSLNGDQHYFILFILFWFDGHQHCGHDTQLGKTVPTDTFFSGFLSNVDNLVSESSRKYTDCL